MSRVLVLAVLVVVVTSISVYAMPAPAMGADAPGVLQSSSSQAEGAGHHLMTVEEMHAAQGKIGVLEPGRDYNVIFDGFGTGLAPPSQEQWQAMVGEVLVLEPPAEQAPGLPAAYDLSSQPYFPKVGNQRQQGSCAAWASIYYAYGYLEAKDNGWSDAKAGTNSSHLMSPAWTYNKVNGGADHGSWMGENFQIAIDWGVASLATHPYDDSEDVFWGGPAAFREAPLHKASSYHQYYYTGDEAVSQVKTWISEDNPVTFTLDAGEFDFDNGEHIVTSVEYDSSSLNHAQTVVGYDDAVTEDGEVGAFRVVNSWGSGWGDAGYYWITYAAFREISNRAGLFLTTVTDIPDYAPSLLATWHFDSPPMRSGYLNLVEGAYPAEVRSVSPFYEYDQFHAMPAFMCLDVSDFRADFDAGASSFWMGVSGGGAASLDSFKMESYEGGYVPGAPTQASAQSPAVPDVALPGHASLTFARYAPISPAAALEHPTASISSYGQARWTAVVHTSYQGGSCMQSGDVGDGSTSSLQATVSGASGITFHWKISSQPSGDYLRFYVDGALRNSTSGAQDWSRVQASLSAGGHVLRWDYVRDGSGCGNQDTAWVDRLVIVPMDDAFEENDDVTSASPIEPFGSYAGLVGLDEDWYQVSVEADDMLTATLLLNSSEGDLDLYLYGPDGTTLLDASATSGDQEQVQLMATHSGHHYLQVLPDSGQFSRYSLLLAYEPGALDFGKNSSLELLSGTGDLASMEQGALTVEEGSLITGTVRLRASVTWPGAETVPMMATSSWGDPSSAAWLVAADLAAGTADYEATVSVTAPSAPGTHYLTFAFRNESSYAFVASATDDALGSPVYDDGNDLAAFTSAQLDECRAEGRALGNWLRTDGMHPVRIPAAAIVLTVIPPDLTPPETSSALSGTSGAGGWFRSSVSVALSASDQGGSGVEQTLYRLDSGSWTAYSGEFMVLGSAVHSLEYYSVDRKGNVEGTVARSVKIDMSAPVTSATFSGTLGEQSWYVEAPHLQLSSTDGLSGVQSLHYRLDGGSWRTYSAPVPIVADGLHAIDYYSMDLAGNSEGYRQTSVKVDRNAPVTSVLVEGPEGAGGWYGGAVSLSLSASDQASGVLLTSCSLDGGEWAVYQGTMMVGGEGEHELLFNSTDVAGNHEATQSFSFKIDSTAPVTSAALAGELGQAGWYVGEVEVSVTAQDALSGVAATEYSLDGGPWTEYLSPFVIADSGEHSLRFRSSDMAGVLEEARQLTVQVDVSPPQADLEVEGELGSGGWYVSGLGLSPLAIDQGSGLAHFLYRLDGGLWEEMPGVLPVMEDGEHVIEFYAVDAAGNAGSVMTRSLRVDTSAPASACLPQGSEGLQGWFVSLVDVGIASSDAGSGVAAIFYSLQGAAWRQYTGPIAIDTEGVHELRYYALDVAGNAEPVRDAQIRLELSLPTSTLDLAGEPGLGGWYVSQVLATIDASDPLSGVAFTYFRLDGGHWQEYQGAIQVLDGRHWLDFYSVDMAGNQELFHAQELHVDATPPTALATAAGDLGSDEWFVSGVTVSLSATDGTSGVNATSYSIDGGEWLGYASPFALAEGVHRVSYAAIDLAGNVGPTQDLMVRCDLLAPESRADYQGDLGIGAWFVTPVGITLSSQDATSGVGRTEYRLEGGDWAPYTGRIWVNSSGIYHLEFRARDLAGNLEAGRAEQFKIDLDPPTFQVTRPQRVFTTDQVSIGFVSADQDSAVGSILLRLDNGTPFLDQGTDAKLELGQLEDGWHELEVVVTDGAGNTYREVLTFKVDTNPLSPEGPFGPWLLIGLAALAVAALALVLPRRRGRGKGPGDQV